MSTTIITKNSSTASAVPAAGDLVAGELAVNTADKKLYTKSGSTVVKVVGSLGNQEANAVDITGGTIVGMSAPSVSSGAANKGYVDGLISTGASNAAAAAASAILANDWATKTSGTVVGGEYSAKYHAQAAATSASSATTSASNASTSATAAATAQTAAEAARDATLTAYDNFDDRYLGTKTSDPTVDNDGNALIAGTLYFNSVSQVMRLYTGSAWVAAYVSGAGYLASANNLSDVASAATARTNLGLGTAATMTGPSGAIVGTTDAQTLTNKTLTTPTLSTPNITTGLTVTGSSGTAGQVLTSAGAGAAPTWSTISGAQTLTINSNTTLSAGNQYLVDTSLNTITVTLPASPSTGNTVAIYDANNMFGNNALTINPNGSTLAFRSGNVIVNQNGRNIFLRYNGTTWVSEAIPSNGLPQLNSQATTYSITGGLSPQNAMGFGAGLFVALTWNSYAITSPDGITWTQRNLPSVKNWSSVAYGNGRFVAVSGYTAFSSSTAYSTDGINWTASTCDLGKWISIAYGNGVFCSIRSDVTSSAQTSTDGITWSTVTLAASTNWTDIVYGNGVFVAKSDGSSGNTTFNTSSNGSSWTSSGGLGFNAGCIAYGNGIFVALNGAGGNASYVSGDGLTWQVFTANLPATGSYNKLVFHNNTFFGFRSSSSSYIYSYDGCTWMTGSLSNTVTGMAAAGNGIIATVSSLASTGNQLRIV